MEELSRAESWMSTQPDSALILLESIPFPEKQDRENQAYYCLLLTEAQDKTYYEFTSDSIIRIALDYYEMQNDKQRLPQAYYYMGRVCHTLYNAPQAINYYLKAKDALAQDTDYALEARIYNQLGVLYVTLRFNENAATAYQKAYKALSLAGDSANLPIILRNIARTYDDWEKRDSAVIYYNKAIYSAAKTGNLACEQSSRIELVSLFLRENRLTEAKEQKDIAVDLYKDEEMPPQTCLILSDFFYTTGQIDSARYYLRYSINTDDPYTHAASIKQLSLLEEKEHNYKQAVIYHHEYNSCRDSIEAMMDQKSVADMEHFYHYQQIENENNRLKVESAKRELWTSRIFFFIVLILIVVVAYFFYYQQKKKKEKLMLMHQISLQREKLMKSVIYKEIKRLTADKIIPEDLWLQFKDEVDTIYDNFENKLNKLYPSMSDLELKVCYLLKAEFRISEIASLSGRALPTITTCRKRLYEKITKQQGTASDLDQLITNL